MGEPVSSWSSSAGSRSSARSVCRTDESRASSQCAGGPSPGIPSSPFPVCLGLHFSPSNQTSERSCLCSVLPTPPGPLPFEGPVWHLCSLAFELSAAVSLDRKGQSSPFLPQANRRKSHMDFVEGIWWEVSYRMSQNEPGATFR